MRAHLLPAGLFLLCSALLAADPPAPPKLPPPFETKSVTKHPKVIGWPEGKTPTAPEGFSVTLYADKFDSPRWLYVLPTGDVLVAESRALPKNGGEAGGQGGAGEVEDGHGRLRESHLPGWGGWVARTTSSNSAWRCTTTRPRSAGCRRTAARPRAGGEPCAE